MHFPYAHRFNVEISDESYQVSWLDLVAEEEEKNEAKAKKDFKGSKAMMGGSIDPYASDDDDQLKVSSDMFPFLVHLIYISESAVRHWPRNMSRSMGAPPRR